MACDVLVAENTQAHTSCESHCPARNEVAAALAAKDLPAEPAVVLPPQRRELGLAAVAVAADGVRDPRAPVGQAPAQLVQGGRVGGRGSRPRTRSVGGVQRGLARGRRGEALQEALERHVAEIDCPGGVGHKIFLKWALAGPFLGSIN